MKPLLTALLLVCGFTAELSRVQAAQIDVTLFDETLTGKPLDVLGFRGTLTNNGSSGLFLNGATLSLAGFSPIDSDLTPFILNASGLLGLGQSFGPTELFSVTIPDLFPNGLYPGVLTIQGGATDIDDLVLRTVDFHVKVETVPEPNSLLLAACGLCLVLLLGRRLRELSTAKPQH